MKRPALRLIGCALLAYFAVLAGSCAWARAPVQHQSCPAAETLVLVDTDARVLSLCRAGQAEHVYRVAIGRGGSGKQREGDGRTPLGRYSLAEARPSRRYHLFLPVGYPTAEQAERGYSGSAIGLHGPHVAFTWLGHATSWPNWTLGCVALGTWGQIREVSSWVSRYQARTVVFVRSRGAAQR